MSKSYIRLLYISTGLSSMNLNHVNCSHPNIKRLLRRSDFIYKFSAGRSRCNNDNITWSEVTRLRKELANIIICVQTLKHAINYHNIAIFTNFTALQQFN